MHKPVLLEEVLEYLRPKPGDVVLDATVGNGGHARAIAEQVVPNGLVIGVDQDPEALQRAADALRTCANVKLTRSNFRDLDQLVCRFGIEKLDAVLFDLGVSSEQLESGKRGFSFLTDGPLDMRMDPSGGRTAADLICDLTEKELTDLFFRFGEERRSRHIAKRIVARRRERPFRTTADLAEAIKRCFPRSYYRIHPATRVFQALRISVNDELHALENGLAGAVRCLGLGGRIVVISFHSLEDRIVKKYFRSCEEKGWLKIVTEGVVKASEKEVASNPRARSAKLRAAEKVRAYEDNR